MAILSYGVSVAAHISSIHYDKSFASATASSSSSHLGLKKSPITCDNSNNGSFTTNPQVNTSTSTKSTLNKLHSLLDPKSSMKTAEKIEASVGFSTLNKTRCHECEKGLVVCATCSGSGLYIDSIMECQGIIVKVCCLGCGGSGNILCSACGGRGHL